MPPIPAKLEKLLDAGQYDLIDRTKAASRARPPSAGAMPLSQQGARAGQQLAAEEPGAGEPGEPVIERDEQADR